MSFEYEVTGLVHYEFIVVLHYANWKYMCAELNYISFNINNLIIKFLELVRMWWLSCKLYNEKRPKLHQKIYADQSVFWQKIMP